MTNTSKRFKKYIYTIETSNSYLSLKILEYINVKMQKN